MKKTFILTAIALALSVPAGAQPPSSAAALQYYVGTWACVGGPTTDPPVNATTTYTLESGVLRLSGLIQPQGKMKKVYAFSGATSYDATHHRYASSYLDNDGGWEISIAKPWSGNTEHWIDLSTDSGKLNRTDIVRSGANHFSITAYAMKAASPNFKVSCKRSS